MAIEVELMFFTNPQLIEIIIKTFLWNPYEFSSLLKINTFAFIYSWMQWSPFSYKFNDFPNCSLFAPLFFCFILTVIVFSECPLIFRIFDHNNLEFKIINRYQIGFNTNILKRDIRVCFRMINFKLFVLWGFYMFNYFFEVNDCRVSRDGLLEELHFFCLFLLKYKGAINFRWIHMIFWSFKYNLKNSDLFNIWYTESNNRHIFENTVTVAMPNIEVSKLYPHLKL